MSDKNQGDKPTRNRRTAQQIWDDGVAEINAAFQKVRDEAYKAGNDEALPKISDARTKLMTAIKEAQGELFKARTTLMDSIRAAQSELLKD